MTLAPARPRRRPLTLLLLLAALALGVAPVPETCTGPSGERCHERDPATDHDGQPAEHPRDCSTLR